jgi:hypothetical protein
MTLHCEEGRAKQMTMNAEGMRDVWKLMEQRGEKDHLHVEHNYLPWYTTEPGLPFATALEVG